MHKYVCYAILKLFVIFLISLITNDTLVNSAVTFFGVYIFCIWFYFFLFIFLFDILCFIFKTIDKLLI